MPDNVQISGTFDPRKAFVTLDDDGKGKKRVAVKRVIVDCVKDPTLIEVVERLLKYMTKAG